jgi:antitoxin (DNA-binding transcriptional repressor) of toxin-antitoxin stability system
MAAKATIRDLRNRFPTVRRLVESEGQAIVTEKGEPKYRLTLFTAARAMKASSVDYWARLTAYMPQPLTTEQAAALRAETVASGENFYVDPSALLKLYL